MAKKGLWQWGAIAMRVIIVRVIAVRSVAIRPIAMDAGLKMGCGSNKSSNFRLKLLHLSFS